MRQKLMFTTFATLLLVAVFGCGEKGQPRGELIKEFPVVTTDILMGPYTGLEPEVGEVQRESFRETDFYTFDRVTFDGFAGDRVTAILGLPKVGEPPYPVLYYFHRKREDKTAVIAMTESLQDSGLAVFGFDLPGQGERFDAEQQADPNMVRPWVKHIQRGIMDGVHGLECLESFEEIDQERIVAVGASLGAGTASVLAGIDSRMKAVALIVLGPGVRSRVERTRFQSPELGEEVFLAAVTISPAEYLARVSPRPLLMIGARNDNLIPREATEALFGVAGEPKDLVWLEEQHFFPFENASPQLLDWLKRRSLL